MDQSTDPSSAMSASKRTLRIASPSTTIRVPPSPIPAPSPLPLSISTNVPVSPIPTTLVSPLASGKRLVRSPSTSQRGEKRLMPHPIPFLSHDSNLSFV